MRNLLGFFFGIGWSNYQMWRVRDNMGSIRCHCYCLLPAPRPSGRGISTPPASLVQSHATHFQQISSRSPFIPTLTPLTLINPLPLPPPLLASVSFLAPAPDHPTIFLSKISLSDPLFSSNLFHGPKTGVVNATQGTCQLVPCLG